MHPIIYDVAVSLDGYISGPGGDISQFAHDGPVVDDYATRLAGYDTAIMGRATYEFGYAYGLEPGQNPYPHLKTIVFSDRLDIPTERQITLHPKAKPEAIRQIKETANGPIYLCGGGAFAGSLLRHGLIDRVVLKRAPFVAGGGVKLFDGQDAAIALTRTAVTRYDNGYLLEEFTA